MTTKKPTPKHMADVTKPKKPATSAPAAERLVIPKRPMAVPVASEDDHSAAPEPITVKRTAKSVQPENPVAAPAPETPKSPEAPTPPDTPAAPPAPKDNADPPAPDMPEPEPSAPADPAPASDHPNPHVRKALEDAKRQEQINQHIENRDFFVPVNTVARKRSIKVSAALIFVELLLGLLLLNLMLDAGLIELLYKIPHTNFFTT